ncbi:MAG: hypothetical protein HYY06_03710 [Deltaproteobacteria bacterium]|nr:hypothetical protein [Deltaproteobacteria bacterium]
MRFDVEGKWLAIAVMACGQKAPEQPEPRTLASQQGVSGGICADAHAAYWIVYRDTDQEGRVLRVDGHTGRLTVLADRQPRAMRGCAVDETHVYWINLGSAIMRVPKDGGPAEQVTGLDSDSPDNLVVRAGVVYWAAGGNAMRAPAGGGDAIVAFRHGREDIRVGSQIAVGSTGIFWTEPIRGEVLRIPPSGGAPEVFASSETTPQSVAVDDANVYWLAGSAVRIRRKVGGAPARDLFSSDAPLLALAESGRHLYVATSQGVHRIAKADGAAQCVSRGNLVAIGGGTVYSSRGSTASSVELLAAPR